MRPYFVPKHAGRCYAGSTVGYQAGWISMDQRWPGRSRDAACALPEWRAGPGAPCLPRHTEYAPGCRIAELVLTYAQRSLVGLDIGDCSRVQRCQRGRQSVVFAGGAPVEVSEVLFDDARHPMTIAVCKAANKGRVSYSSTRSTAAIVTVEREAATPKISQYAVASETLRTLGRTDVQKLVLTRNINKQHRHV